MGPDKNIISTQEVPEIPEDDVEHARMPIATPDPNDPSLADLKGITTTHLFKHIADALLLVGETEPRNIPLSGRRMLYLRTGDNPGIYFSMDGGSWIEFELGSDDNVVNQLIATWWGNLANIPIEKLPSGIHLIRSTGNIPVGSSDKQMLWFMADRTGLNGFVDEDGSTPITSASTGDVFQIINARWQKRFNVIGGGIDTNAVNTAITAAVAAWALQSNATEIPESKVTTAVNALIAAWWNALERIPEGKLPSGTGLDTNAVNDLIATWWTALTTIPEGKIPFVLKDFRESRPSPPSPTASQAEIDIAKRTIGIGNDGVTWTFELIPASDAAGTWGEFDNDHFEFEQTGLLPIAALETGDFYYIYPTETWISFDGVRQTEVTDISTILPDHIFLGNASNAQSAVHLITNYDSNKTYLAYFDGEVQQLQSYTAGTLASTKWIQSTETLHHELARIESEIEVERARITDILESKTTFLSVDNFPVDDPDDKTVIVFKTSQTSFTSGKTVRNEADDADVTSASANDWFQFFENGTKWVRQLRGITREEFLLKVSELENADTALANRVTALEAGGGTPATPGTPANTEGALVATSAVLPTVAQETAFTGAWTFTTAVTGLTQAGGVMRLPKLRPTNSVFGWTVAAYEGATKVGETFLDFGAYGPDPDSLLGLSYPAKPLSFGNGEVIMIDYFHDDGAGDSLQLVGVGKTLPANATVRVHLAVAGNVTQSDQSGQREGQEGVAFILPTLIELTQWARGSSIPAVPGRATYNTNTGDVDGLDVDPWHSVIPIGAEQLWLATATIRRVNGVWQQSSLWTVTSTDSSLIQFYDGRYNRWTNSPDGNSISAQIWTLSGWRTLSLSTQRLLLTSGTNHTWVTLHPTLTVDDIAEIHDVIFEVTSGDYDFSTRISAKVLWGDLSGVGQGVPDSNNYGARDDKTAIVVWGNDGRNSVQVIAHQGLNRGNAAQWGGFFVRAFKNASNELTHIVFHNPFGIADPLNAVVRIYLEY